MQVIDREECHIHVTRGDILSFKVEATIDGADYLFTRGDVLRLKIMERKKAQNVLLQKDFVVEEDTNAVPIYLDYEETKIGPIINKPKKYWYEIELNPDSACETIIGYDDENGEKLLTLYPEGSDLE